MNLDKLKQLLAAADNPGSMNIGHAQGQLIMLMPELLAVVEAVGRDSCNTETMQALAALEKRLETV